MEETLYPPLQDHPHPPLHPQMTAILNKEPLPFMVLGLALSTHYIGHHKLSFEYPMISSEGCSMFEEIPSDIQLGAPKGLSTKRVIYQN